MRSMLCIFLLVPVLALAGNTQPVTVLPGDPASVNATPVQKVTSNPNPVAKAFYVGTVDTIGGTTYDWQYNGPAYRVNVSSPGNGLHVGWMFSAEMSGTTFPDRNMRYNYYDYTANAWNWIDPDFMASGVNAYTERTGFGNMDVDPATGVAVFVAHGGSPLRPIAARDMAPGAGIFEFCNGSPNAEAYQWPYSAVGQGSKIHTACVDNATQDNIWYTKCDPWCTWEVPRDMAGSAPQPLFPTQNITAARNSQDVAYTWELSEGTPYEAAYIRTSSDGGVNWSDPTEITIPPVYGTDTTTTFHISSLFPWYDRSGNLHIVSSFAPIVNETTYIIPAEIWHWTNNTWHKIHRAGCDPANLQAAVGYNVIYASRPNIGADDAGNLFVAWEQFDSANVEPVTNLLRADVWAAGSTDGGATWTTKQLTDPGLTCSNRFPVIADRPVDLPGGRYIPVVYVQDLCAGFTIQGQGTYNHNPVCVQWVPVESLGVGISENPPVVPTRIELSATPNPFSGRTAISYGVPRSGDVSLVLYDASGRPVRTLASGMRDAGRYNVNLEGSGLAGGVYFYKLVTEGSSVTKKLTLAR